MNVYIKDMLAKKGLTQKEIATKIGVTQSNISATISRPSFPTLERIASALNVQPWELLAPPSVVEELKQARAARDDFAAFVRYHGKTYTPETLEELAAVVDVLRDKQQERQQLPAVESNHI